MDDVKKKLTTAGGLEGIAGAAMISSHTFDRSVGETPRGPAARRCSRTSGYSRSSRTSIAR